MDDQRADREGGSLIKAAIAVLLGTLGYAIVGFLLYRERTTTNLALFDSDFIVFYLPMLLAIALNAGAILYVIPKPATVQYVMALFIALAITLGVMAAYMTVAINSYGA